MLDAHRLRLLRELRHRGTLAAVARALGYSPSTISHQLAVLERKAGVPLRQFNQYNHPVTNQRTHQEISDHPDERARQQQRRPGAVRPAGRSQEQAGTHRDHLHVPPAQRLLVTDLLGVQRIVARIARSSARFDRYSLTEPIGEPLSVEGRPAPAAARST
jgi:hypothetical protein